MKNILLNQYEDFVSNKFISFDEKQYQTLNLIENIWLNNKKINLFFKKKKYSGIYVYGSVGIGKTFILNLFIKRIDSRGIKYHFNHLMMSLHAFINNSSNKEIALEQYIKNISKWA